ncbi:MAG: hypothetical protein DRN53_03485 [Thermoprotei archaeon]|nr:MAG: hypothetical protein DRN53_03485 [Thermoprotei archaeon]
MKYSTSNNSCHLQVDFIALRYSLNDEAIKDEIKDMRIFLKFSGVIRNCNHKLNLKTVKKKVKSQIHSAKTLTGKQIFINSFFLRNNIEKNMNE